MRRIEWLTLGLLVASAVAAAPPSETGRAYEKVGMIAVQQHGRRKPFDTLARQAVKQIYGSESIKEPGPEGAKPKKWPAVAAVIDWMARPSHWDDQEILEARYLPLRQLILAETVKDRLKAAADRPSTPPAARNVLRKLAASSDVSASELASAAAEAGLSAEDRKALNSLAVKLGPEHKWLAPSDLDDAVVTVGGRKQPFDEWLRELYSKRQQVAAEGAAPRRKGSASGEQLSTLEERALDLWERWIHYRALRDKDGRMIEAFEIEVIPRPVNATYIAFSAEALKKLSKGEAQLSPLEEDALRLLQEYKETLQRKDWKLPGTDKDADARLLKWVRDNSSWLPLRHVLDLDIKELERAGYSPQKVEAFRQAFSGMQAAEEAGPGKLPEEKAAAVLAASRDLGSSASDAYPQTRALALETFYNRAAPFAYAPWIYGFAVVFLVLCLGIAEDRRTSVGKVLYGVGMTALVAGIATEIFGFSLRVRISGWAPVTNMYETVIWVALVASVIGLVLELISRKVFCALAASSVAVLATALAANVSLLEKDSGIKNLTPVLRSNYWLTIHVLTEVSSYAAFALAMSLGLIAVGYYLTATYRRTARFKELAIPLIAGLPLLVVGSVGVYDSYAKQGPPWVWTLGGYYLVAGVAGLGGILTIIALFGMIGEAANRAPAQTLLAGLAALTVGLVGTVSSYFGLIAEWIFSWAAVVAGLGAAVAILSRFGAITHEFVQGLLRQTQAYDESALATAPAATAVQTVSVGEGGGVATLTRPSVAEIRSRAAGTRPKLDHRGQAMQATAARIKPISNFIYRAIQVGVLLVAAGTFLGGWWADKSWGRFWGWDPKEVWALITLLVYLVPLHGRFAGWINTFGLVVSSVVCFGSVLMAWYGVNFVLGVGLHSYGFGDGAGQGLVLATTLAVISVVLAAVWRRSLSQERPSVIG
jgi:ABC-type transport system involved in cytochrome c biogenesis permease subunit